MEKITNGNTLSQSPDFVKENINTLKTLFPTIVKEGKIDIEELRALLGQDAETDEEYYRFTWAGKSLARREANKPSTATLRPNKADSKDWDTTQNIFIEGDNLEALKLLQKSYAKQIKMIYIDPPYNTGNDFVYKDNYADNLNNYLALTGQLNEDGKKNSTNTETDGRFHSNWLNMIYPRLKLAFNLLTDDGVILISNDYHESHNIRKVADEIFGESNFLGELVWNLKSGAQAGHFTRSNEFITVYCRNKEKLAFFGDNTGGTINHGALKKISKANPASEIEFPAGIEIEGGADVTFTGELGGSEKQYIISEEMRFVNGKLVQPTIIKAGWGMKDQIESWINGEETVDSKGQKLLRLYFNPQGILWYEKERGTYHPKTVLPEQEVGTTKNGTKEIAELFGAKVFDFPKPTSLIKYLIEVVTASDKNCYVLDFFAGSGSTADAIMQLNAQDGGERKFICVQLPELTNESSEAYKSGFKSIAEITKERLRRSGEKVKSITNNDLFSDKGKFLDVGFKVFKLDSSNIQAWDGNPEKLDQSLFNANNNIKPNRTEEDVLYEILLKYGLDLSQNIERKEILGKPVFNIGSGVLFICLADGITKGIAEEIGKWKKELEPTTCKVIFKDTGFTDVEKTNSIQVLKGYGIEEVSSI